MNLHMIRVADPERTDEDIRGVAEMRSELGPEYSLYFWCRDRDVDAFERKLSVVNRITHGVTVRGIESMLGTSTGTAFRLWNWYGAKEAWAIEGLQDVVAVAAGRDANARDRVNLKNAFAYYLLYTWGGYVMDSNITPTPAGGSVRLRDYDRFMAPALRDRTGGVILIHRPLRNDRIPRWSDVRRASCATGTRGSRLITDLRAADEIDADDSRMDVVEGWNPECWALFSPQYSVPAWRALEHYLRAWPRLKARRATLVQRLGEGVDGREKDDLQGVFHDLSANAVIDAALYALTHDDAGRCTEVDVRRSIWPADKDGMQATVKELGIVKTYGNSHKAKNVRW